MPYATATELLDRFDAEEVAQRTDRSTPRLVTAELLRAAAAGGDLSGYTAAEQAAAVAALSLINSALVDADNTVDGYLAVRYAVPLASPPAVVRRLACDLARYFLYDDQATETIQKRHDAAERFFREVGAGKLSLGVDMGAAAQPAGGTVEITSGGSVFGRSDKGFI